VRSREIAFPCPACREEVSAGAEGQGQCERCGRSTVLPLTASLREGGPVDRCPACDGVQLYVQRDFNQKAGLAIVGLGALLAPFTRYFSLLAAAVLDALLYALLPEITVCYRCASHFRGFPRNPRHAAFDLHIAEQYHSGAPPHRDG
jgi:hypothetical protein